MIAGRGPRACLAAHLLTSWLTVAALWAEPPGPVPRSWPAGGTAVAISGSVSHVYAADLAAGEVLEVSVDQDGVDVVLTVFGPADEPLLRVDGPTGPSGREVAVIVAEIAGRYRLVVDHRGGATGSYRPEIRLRRPATPRDRLRATAARHVDAADAVTPGDRDRRLAAVDELRHALELYERLGDPRGEAEVHDRLGRLSAALGDRPAAIEHFARAILLFDRADEPRRKVQMLHQIGRQHRLNGEPERMREANEQALEIASQLGDRRLEGFSIGNLGLYYKRQGELRKAIAHYERAIELWRQLGDTLAQATPLANVGDAYLALGKPDEALVHSHRALEIWREGEHQPGQARALTSIGRAHLRAGRWSRALEALHQALRLQQELANRRGEAVALLDIANTYFRQGRIDDALQHNLRALEIFDGQNDWQSVAAAHANLGRILTERGQPTRALASFERALDLLRRLEADGDVASVLFGMARALRALGRLDEARKHIEQSLELIEALRSDTANQSWRMAFSAAKHDYHDFHVDLLMELHRRRPGAGFATLALLASERARARSFLDSLAETRAEIRLGASHHWLRREEAAQRQLDFLESERIQRLSRDADDPQLPVLARQIQEQVKTLDRIREEIRLTSPRYAEMTRPGVPDVDALRRSLPKDTVLLVFFLGAERSFSWVISRERITAFELPNRQRIETAARGAHHHMARSSETGALETARASAAALGRGILGPMVDHLEARRWWIVADGALQYVPFAALPDPREATIPASPLLARHEIVTLPSLSILELLRRDLEVRPPAPKLLAVLADPVFDPDDPRVSVASPSVRPPPEEEPRVDPPRAGDPPRAEDPLAATGFRRLLHSRREGEAVLALVPAGDRFQAFDFAANRQTVESGVLADYRWIHFATHGVLHSRHPELSGIVLSRVDAAGRPLQGILRAHEIYLLDLPADLVVLSACQTALGPEIRGEGVLGLTRGFMAAGASSVMVSLWNVRDQATSILMQRFYRAMVQGAQAPPAALRSAQLSMLAEPRWSAPYYWAGFVLQGVWRSPPADSPGD